jgi:hypothetical protein
MYVDKWDHKLGFRLSRGKAYQLKLGLMKVKLALAVSYEPPPI